MSKLEEYLIDTSAIISFYTPLMASIEVSSGMSFDEVCRSRMYSILFHTFAGRTYGKFRSYYAQQWNANSESSQMRKLFIDTSALVLFQIPNYSLILYASGASLEEITVALPAGLTVGALSGRPYGFFLDRWRTFWGKKATL